MPFWSTFWDTIGWFLTFFIFIAYLFALFTIIVDLFRDKAVSGIGKAIWLLFLVFVPFLTALVYLIVRGRGIGERAAHENEVAKAATDDYIRSVAGGGGAAEVTKAKQLLDNGAITQAEFERLKHTALGSPG